MNVHQVNQEWWQHAQAERQRPTDLATRSAQRIRAAHAWLAIALPALADDPFALLATLRLKDDAPGEPVTASMVRGWLVKHAEERHHRGWINDAELTERLAELAA